MKSVQAAKAFAALAQESRLNVLRLLVEAGPDGLPAGAISKAMGMAHNSMSFHLAQLKEAELISATKQGRSMIYQANFNRINGLVRFLLEDCCASASGDCEKSCDLPGLPMDQNIHDKPRLKFTWSQTQ